MAKSTVKRTAAREQPWWLAEGDEICVHCGQVYHIEREIRCPDCDGPTCPACVVRIESRIACRDCAASPSAEE